MATRREMVAMLAAAPIAPAAARVGSIPKPAALAGRWGDQGDGSFVNPILPADFCDIDVIAVGDLFYAISSVQHLSPGIAVLRSADLVNWAVIGHCLADVTPFGAGLGWQAMRDYGRGMWAGSIRHHDGLFHVHFTSPDTGLFVTSARSATGPWSAPHPLLAEPGHDDPCALWDTDGRAYLAMTRFGGEDDAYSIRLYDMAPDGRSIDPASAREICRGAGAEANKLYRWGDLYWHFYSEVRPEGRVPMIARAARIDGPWAARPLLHVDPRVDKEPNQGGIVRMADGRWWFLTHQGTGDWEGRALCLLPVRWQDGWPMAGETGADGIGRMMWRAPMPAPSVPMRPVLADRFAGPALDPRWEWNHQPRADHVRWLPGGGLRLRAFPPAPPGSFLEAGNTLSQRVMRTPANGARVRIDVSAMADGQQAGLCHFSRNHALFGVRQDGGRRRLVCRIDESAPLLGPRVGADALWLRSDWDLAGRSRFSYSLDGVDYVPFGPAYRLRWGYYRGDRVGVFTVNPAGDAGSIDVLRFDTCHTDQTGARLVFGGEPWPAPGAGGGSRTRTP